jgi:hypothetical protein
MSQAIDEWKIPIIGREVTGVEIYSKEPIGPDNFVRELKKGDKIIALSPITKGAGYDGVVEEVTGDTAWAKSGDMNLMLRFARDGRDVWVCEAYMSDKAISAINF